MFWGKGWQKKNWPSGNPFTAENSIKRFFLQVYKYTDTITLDFENVGEVICGSEKYMYNYERPM